MTNRTCTHADCDRGGKLTRGMCAKHYSRWINRTPKEDRPVAPRFADDFWTHVHKSHEHGCWTWTAKTEPKGYGRWRSTLAHRESWRRASGDIPGGLWVLHHCDNPPCVNPAHLYLGTVVENVRDMIERGRNFIPAPKTHCNRGHELAGENLQIAGRRKQRRCRTCGNERSAERERQKRRQAGVALANRVSAQELDAMRELRRGGLTYKAIAARTGRGIATVQRLLRERQPSTGRQGAQHG